MEHGIQGVMGSTQAASNAVCQFLNKCLVSSRYYSVVNIHTVLSTPSLFQHREDLPACYPSQAVMSVVKLPVRALMRAASTMRQRNSLMGGGRPSDGSRLASALNSAAVPSGALSGAYSSALPGVQSTALPGGAAAGAPHSGPLGAPRPSNRLLAPVSGLLTALGFGQDNRCVCMCDLSPMPQGMPFRSRSWCTSHWWGSSGYFCGAFNRQSARLLLLTGGCTQKASSGQAFRLCHRRSTSRLLPAGTPPLL